MVHAICCSKFQLCAPTLQWFQITCRHLESKLWVMDEWLAARMGVNSNFVKLSAPQGPPRRGSRVPAKKAQDPIVLDYDRTLYRFYNENWVQFGQILTDMEAEGMMVNRQHLAAAQKLAEEEQDKAIKTFMAWAEKMVPDAKYMNPSSQQQVRLLLRCCKQSEHLLAPSEHRLAHVSTRTAASRSAVGGS